MQTRGDWNKRFVLSEEAIKCLKFWRVNLPDMSLKRHLASKPTSCVIFSDASATGGSAFISKIGPGRQPAVGEKQVSLTNTEISGNFDLSLSNPRQSSEFIAMTQWDKCQQKASSTWRELKTIEWSLESFGQVLQGRKVKWYTDNLGGTRIAKKGSMKPVLNELAGNLSEICFRYGIELELKWIRRNKNKVADKLSRFIDWDDWSVSLVLFTSVNSTWGPFTVDRFATEKNNKVRKFNSRFSCPGTAAVDAFSQDWKGEINWLVPPPSLIPEVIRHLFDTKAKGT